MSGRVVNEFRHNLVTDDWVVFSSARRGRPRQVQPYAQRCNLTSLPSHDATCPFCLGNEHETPEATLTVNYPGTDKWRLRVVPNKFPVVTDSVVSCDLSVSRGGGAEGCPDAILSAFSFAICRNASILDMQGRSNAVEAIWIGAMLLYSSSRFVK